MCGLLTADLPLLFLFTLVLLPYILTAALICLLLVLLAGLFGFGLGARLLGRLRIAPCL